MTAGSDPAVDTDRRWAENQDRDDPLAAHRALFDLPDVIYLNGNSLGVLPRAVRARVQRVVDEEWGQGLVRSWNDADWIHLPQVAGRKIARLIGAGPDEVTVADSTSVNLFKMLAVAVHLRPGRTEILTEAGNFPSDLYIMEGLARFVGRQITVRAVEPEGIPAALDDDVAVLSLTHVNYRSGRMHDLPALTRLAHQRGALALWDLAHSAGAVPVGLSEAGADLAVGCGYKYLNGGPGAPGFLYVARRWQAQAEQPLQGWLGHASPFAFDPSYRPAEGIVRHQCGTPPVLSMAALDAALEAFDGVSLDVLREKSLALSRLFISLFDASLAELGFELASPRNEAERGSQISIAHPHAYPICRALIDAGVIGDFREPDLIRFGFTPLFLRYVDVWDAVQRLAGIMRSERWRTPEFSRRSYVT